MENIEAQGKYYNLKLHLYTMFVIYTELPRLYRAYGGRIPFDWEYESVEDMIFVSLMHVMPSICQNKDPEVCKHTLMEYADDGFKRTMLFTWIGWNKNVNTSVSFPLNKLELEIILCVTQRFLYEDGSALGEALYDRERTELNKVINFIKTTLNPI